MRLMIVYIIKVRMPGNESRTFTTTYFQKREGRILFTDKFGNTKDFPEAECFIEGVEQ